MMQQDQSGPLLLGRNSVGRTPFRYPGGKAFLAEALEQRIKSIGGVDTYAEPYAGGAGAAIQLLARNVVSQVVLNDFDRRVFAAWKSILECTDEFIERIRSTPATLDNWHICKQVVEENRLDTDILDLGFATYFLNRTNHSGVIIGAGPIGGYRQTGKWLIDARYYPETMIKRIRWLGSRRDVIKLSNDDGLTFLRSYPSNEAKRTFFFIDPPYVQAGAKLYLNAMSDLKHRDLAAFLMAENRVPNWLVTYDDCQLIFDAYEGATIDHLSVRYSLRRKRTEHEVCVVPNHAA